MAQYGDVEPATEADVSGKLENLQKLMGQSAMPEDGEFSEEEMDRYVSGVRVYEDRFEWLLNLSPDAGGGLDDAGSPVYFKKITVTPDDEWAWFKNRPSENRLVFPVTAHDTVHDAVHAGVHQLVQCRIFFQSNPSSWCRILTLFWRDCKRKNEKAGKPLVASDFLANCFPFSVYTEFLHSGRFCFCFYG